MPEDWVDVMVDAMVEAMVEAMMEVLAVKVLVDSFVTQAPLWTAANCVVSIKIT